MDRDLKRTGNSIVLLSAGAGVFTVDPSLAQTTKQRMLDNGIGMDMLSLAVPPLHTTPVFIHRREENGQQSGDFDYEIPHWINLRFVDPSQAQDPRAWIAAAAPRRAREGWRMEPLSLHTPRRHEPESPIHFSPARRRQYTGDKDPAGAKLARMPSALAFLVDSYSECAQELQSLSSSDSRDDCNDIPPSTTGKKSVNALVANKSTGMHGSVDEEKPEGTLCFRQVCAHANLIEIGRPKHPSKDDFSSLFDSEFISESR